jgi:hypothetical protein
MGAFAAGLSAGFARGSQGREHKQMLSDQEFQTNLADAQQHITGLTQKLGTIAPTSTEYADTQGQLANAIQARTALFHPAVHPNAVQELGKAVGQHLHLIHPDLPAAVVSPETTTETPGVQLPAGAPQLPATSTTTKVQGPPQTPAQLKAMAQAHMVASGLPTYQPSPLSVEEQHRAAMVNAGLEPKAVAEKPDTWKVLTTSKPFKGEDGIYYQTEMDASGNLRRSPLPAGYAPSASTGKPPTANQMLWNSYAASLGTTADKLSDPQKAGFLNWEARQHAMGHSTTSEHVEFDANGHPHLVTTHSNSTPVSAGGASSGSSASGKMRKLAHGNAQQPGAEAAGAPARAWVRATPQSTTALKAVDTAEGSLRDVEQAAQDPTPVGDQGIVLSWLRGRVNRVTTTEIKAVNNLGGAEMKLEGNLVRLASGKMSNAQRQWFLQSARNNYANAQAVAAKYGGGDNAAQQPSTTPAAKPTSSGGFNWNDHPVAQ